MTGRIIPILIVLQSSLMAIGFTYSSQFGYLWISVGLGLGWILAFLFQRRIMLRWVIVFVYLLATMGLIGQVIPVWLFASCIIATITWDLDHFIRYIQSVERIESRDLLVRNHCLRLLSFMGLGSAFIVPGFYIDLKLNLYLVVLLVCIFLFCLKRMIKNTDLRFIKR